MTIYNIGTGIADITNPAIDLVMQGMADPDQKTTGVESRIYARAFIVQDSSSSKSVVIVIADILAGMEAVKSEVIKRLGLQFKSLYNDNSVLISGTHTHSAPGGFSHSKLYEHVIGGFNPHTLMAYQQEFRKLANALKKETKIDLNQNPPVKSATVAKSITIRNLSNSAVNLKFFKQSDKLMIMPFIKLQVAQQSDWATPRLRDWLCHLTE